MIRVIRGVDRRKFARELDAFHKIRKHVFFDTFRWDVPIINSWEIDGYDALDPVYLLSINEAGQVVGGLLDQCNGYHVPIIGFAPEIPSITSTIEIRHLRHHGTKPSTLGIREFVHSYNHSVSC